MEIWILSEQPWRYRGNKTHLKYLLESSGYSESGYTHAEVDLGFTFLGYFV